MNHALTDAQLAELRKALQQRFEQLREEIRASLLKSDDEQYLELAGRVHDSGDESVADLLADLNYSATDRLVREIGAVERALIRIPQGSYGACIDCDVEIGFARLKAAPHATRCRDCQTRHERSGVAPGASSI